MGRKKKIEDADLEAQEEVVENASLKAVLRQKYWQLASDPLDFASEDDILAYAAQVLGIGLPQLRNEIDDLY